MYAMNPTLASNPFLKQLLTHAQPAPSGTGNVAPTPPNSPFTSALGAVGGAGPWQPGQGPAPRPYTPPPGASAAGYQQPAAQSAASSKPGAGTPNMSAIMQLLKEAGGRAQLAQLLKALTPGQSGIAADHLGELGGLKSVT